MRKIDSMPVRDGDQVRTMVSAFRNDYTPTRRSIIGALHDQDELGQARLRHKREAQTFLFPLYVRSLDDESELPWWLQTVTYLDCREANTAKLRAAADRLTVPR